MRAIAWLVLLAGCGDDASATLDAPPGDSGPESDAAGPGACDAPATFAEGIIPTRIVHVAAGATGGDGSIAAPFGTIEAAAVVATPGTAIRLGPGMHDADQYVSMLRGTATAPIWIGGEPGQSKPVIAGGGQALQLARAAYVVVHDLEISGSTSNGLNIDDGGQLADPTAAHHVLVQRLHVHDIGTGGNQDCIKVSGINDLAIYDSVIERCGTGGSGIDHVGCHRSVVARNVFDGAMENAVQAKGGSTDVDIRQNRIRIAGSRAINLGGSTDLTLFRPPLSMSASNAEARRIRVFNNVITGLGSTATPFAFVGCIDCLVAHNLARGQQRWHVRILQETPTQAGFTFEPAATGRVINNSFVFAAASLSTAVNVGSNTSPATFSFAHNLWFATDNAAQSMPVLPVPEVGGLYGFESAYAQVPDDPGALLLMESICTGSAESDGEPVLPEVDGTLNGMCRSPVTGIGPLESESCTLVVP